MAFEKREIWAKEPVLSLTFASVEFFFSYIARAQPLEQMSIKNKY